LLGLLTAADSRLSLQIFALLTVSIDLVHRFLNGIAFAGLEIDLGANIKYIQAQMPHTTISRVVETSSHLVKFEDAGATARIGSVLFPTGNGLVTNKEGATS
jgi:hypothetical protein